MLPSPVDFSSQIKRIGIVNATKLTKTRGYSTRIEQMIVLEERWLADKGTDAVLTGLLDELSQDQRFDTIQILEHFSDKVMDFGPTPTASAWQTIATLCEKNDLDAIFSLASYDTDTRVSLKKAKLKQNGMMRDRISVSGQEITLETLIENGWRIYDPQQELVLDEFTSNEQIVASAKGESPIEALQAINERRETLLKQSKNSGSSYGLRMQPQRLDIQRAYYVVGTRNFTLAALKIENGDMEGAFELWNIEVQNSKAKISGRACYNLAILSEFNGDLVEAINWAAKSYDMYQDDATVAYSTALEKRQIQQSVLQEQLISSVFKGR